MNGTYSFFSKDNMHRNGGSFIIQNNEMKPFMIKFEYPKIEVYHIDEESKKKAIVSHQDYSEKILNFDDFQGYWVGFDFGKYRIAGNTNLIMIDKSHYIFVGSEIYSFETDKSSEILDFVSFVDNNFETYPMAIGRENIYFLRDKNFVSRLEMLLNESFNIKICINNAKELYLEKEKGEYQKKNLMNLKILFSENESEKK